MPRLLAISDLHLSREAARAALVNLSPHADDWLIVAGDLADTPEQITFGFAQLAQKFAKVIWTPGNHDLWTIPSSRTSSRGVFLYDLLIEIARDFGIITPEDPYPIFVHETGPLVLAPLFILYDYSFRPSSISENDVYAWAEEASCVCADEVLLHPDPYSGRADWRRARVEETIARLATLPPAAETVLINHFPLEESHAVLPRAPRFTPWCGTKLTKSWHTRFHARAVVFGHLHIRQTRWLDGIPFQEVSLGYSSQWDQERTMSAYLREVQLSRDICHV
jgi:predicted phosphodiesterase